jgi:DNA invertase Pin-like site-specific DNA recombinase
MASLLFKMDHYKFTGRMFEAINGMLLDMLAAVAREDYDDRRRRQAQGQAKAKAEGRYKGRPEDAGRNDGIARMIAAKQSWSSIQAATGCSRATISKIGKRAKVAADSFRNTSMPTSTPTTTKPSPSSGPRKRSVNAVSKAAVSLSSDSGY